MTKKNINRIVTAIFIIALVVLCFFLECSLDMYFMIGGFAVAALAIVIAVLQEKKNNTQA